MSQRTPAAVTVGHAARERLVMRWVPILLLPLFLACAGVGQQLNRMGAESDVSGVLGLPAGDVRCAMVGSTRAFSCVLTGPGAASGQVIAATLGATRLDGASSLATWDAFRRSGCAVRVTDDAYVLWHAPSQGSGFGDWFVLEQPGEPVCVASAYLYG